MAKKLRIEKTPEFEYFANHYDEFMKEEEAADLEDIEIPEEWDRRFRKTMHDTLQKKWKRKRLCRILFFGMAVLAAAMLISQYHRNK